MSKTTDNLAAAFAGESQARNKYTYFAEAARSEGYPYIAKIFEEAAENERRHAKDELRLLGGIGDTAANLREAIGGEDHVEVSFFIVDSSKLHATTEPEGQVVAFVGMGPSLPTRGDIKIDRSNSTRNIEPIKKTVRPFKPVPVRRHLRFGIQIQ